MADISPKQKQFCAEYVIDNNGTKAAIRAGYSPKGARVRGSLLLAKDNVKTELARIRAVLAIKAEHTWELAIRDLQTAFDMAKTQGNVAGMVAAKREMSAISGMHSSTINDNREGLTINVSAPEPKPKLKLA